MPRPIEQYAVIGDCRTAALVGDDGSIDWLCMPRFDSASVFGALLGDTEHGHWSLRPADAAATATRAYATDTFTLVTRWTTDDGEVEVTELMPVRDGSDARSDVIRRVRGLRGTVRMEQELRVRFDYAATLPWMRQIGTRDAPALLAVAGPDGLVVRGTRMTAGDRAHRGEFLIGEGETVDLQLSWFPGYQAVPEPLDVDASIAATTTWWRSWVHGCIEPGAYDLEVRRSLLVLRLLTHEDTGGIVAAATTSLPEDFGGSRNWDYRYVWLRDAALTLEALVHHGYKQEAQAWRQWLLRAIAGDPADVQIMYGLAGERRLTEWEVDTLPGYEGSAPVRVGNAASEQYQADVFGEVMIALDAARHSGVDDDGFSWSLQLALLREAEKHLDQPDSGIWEIRGPERHFTHSRAMLWAAFDRAICAVEFDGRNGPVEKWRELRAGIAERIEQDGYDAVAGQLRAVPRNHRSGRRPAATRADRLPRLRRSADARHGRPDRGDTDPRRARLPLPHRGPDRRCSRRRERLPRVLVLARRALRAQRAPRRRHRADGPPAPPRQRPRTHGRAGGTEHRQAGGQHPAGALAPGARPRRRRDRACARHGGGRGVGERRAKQSYVRSVATLRPATWQTARGLRARRAR